MRYLDTGKLLGRKEEAKKVKRKVVQFTKVDSVLYELGFAAPR